MNTNSARKSVTRFWEGFRDDLHEARQAREEHRTLRRELASYTTPADVNDLLGSLRGQEGEDAEMIRHILTTPLHNHRELVQSVA